KTSIDDKGGLNQPSFSEAGLGGFLLDRLVCVYLSRNENLIQKGTASPPSPAFLLSSYDSIRPGAWLSKRKTRKERQTHASPAAALRRAQLLRPREGDWRIYSFRKALCGQSPIVQLSRAAREKQSSAVSRASIIQQTKSF